MKKMYRQGDLLFIQVKMPSENVKERKTKVILGSAVTGHAHTLTNGTVYETDNPGRFYLNITEEDARVVHEEHGPIPLEMGWWEVRRQREVNGFVQD